MWPIVNGIVLTNQIVFRSEKTHEVTRCKLAQKGTKQICVSICKIQDHCNEEEPATVCLHLFETYFTQNTMTISVCFSTAHHSRGQ